MSKICYGSMNIPLSPAVRAGDFVYISGQVPVVSGQIVGESIEEQTDVCLKNLVEILKTAGCEIDDVIKCFCILPDVKDFPGFNASYAKVFHTNPPARTTVGSALARPFKVEIEAVAYKPLK